jgi:uncharacterized protein (DUF486 family)
MKLLKNILLISVIIKSNICLGLAWYGEFYNKSNVAKSSNPFGVAALCSGILLWFVWIYESEKKKGTL